MNYCPTAVSQYLALPTSLPPASSESWRCCSRLHRAVRQPPYGLTCDLQEALSAGPSLPRRFGPPAPPCFSRRTSAHCCTEIDRGTLASARLRSVFAATKKSQAPVRKSQLCFRFKPVSTDVPTAAAPISSGLRAQAGRWYAWTEGMVVARVRAWDGAA